MTPTGQIRHVPGLDGLRGAAVIGVILFHAGYLPGGYLGVDLFFVLSGFLITTLLLDEHRRTAQLDLIAFWGRRARRLLPALILVLLAVAAYAAFFARPLELPALRADSLATLFYLANWNAITTGQSYWVQFAAPSPLLHTWSLAIEEQFYLVWPVVTLLVLRRGRGPRSLLVVALVGALVSALLMIRGYQPGGDVSRLYFGTDTRAAAVLLGASLACAFAAYGAPRAPRARIAAEAAGWMAVGALGVAWATLDGTSALLYRGGLFACGVACVAVIAAITRPDPGPLATVFSFAPLRGAGLISYGLYLWHVPIFQWLSAARVGWDGLALFALQVGVTVAVALVSYIAIEMPIRRGRLRGRQATMAAAAALGVVVVAVIAATVTPTPAVSAEQAAAGITALGPFGPGPGAPATAERTTVVPGAPTRVLLVGDSVADSLAAGMSPNQDRFGIELRDVTRVGCGPVRTNPDIRLADGTTGSETGCLDTQDRWRDAVADFRPDVVVAAIGWAGNTERFVDGQWRRPCDPVFDRWYAGEIDHGLDVLRASGAPVYLTTAPYLRSITAPADSDRSTDCLNTITRAAADRHPGVHVIDLAAEVCPDHACTEERDGVVLRPDGLHFADASSVWFAQWVLDQAWAAGRAT